MKSLMACAIVAIIFAVANWQIVDSGIAASESRHKRAVAREKCPENTTTTAECEEYAKGQVDPESCTGFKVAGSEIQWFTCGTVGCGENSKLVEGDKNQTYPKCCPHCEIIDKSKPTVVSFVA